MVAGVAEEANGGRGHPRQEVSKASRGGPASPPCSFLPLLPTPVTSPAADWAGLEAPCAAPDYCEQTLHMQSTTGPPPPHHHHTPHATHTHISNRANVHQSTMGSSHPCSNTREAVRTNQQCGVARARTASVGPGKGKSGVGWGSSRGGSGAGSGQGYPLCRRGRHTSGGGGHCHGQRRASGALCSRGRGRRGSAKVLYTQ